MPMSRRFGDMRVTSSPPTRMLPRVGLVEARDEAQRRRLAAAARPEQRHELARLEREVDALERRHGAEGPPQPAQLDVGRHQRPIPTRTVRWPPRRPIRRIEASQPT